MKRTISSQQSVLKAPLELLAYNSIISHLATESQVDFVQCGLYLDEDEIVRFEISPLGAVEPLLNLLNNYADLAYHKCDPESLREIAKDTLQPLQENLMRFTELPLEEKVEIATQDFFDMSSKSGFVELMGPLFSFITGVDGTARVPFQKDFEPMVKQFCETLSLEDIEVAIEARRWLAEQASNEDIRLFVSLNSAYHYLLVSIVVDKLVNMAINVANNKKRNNIELLRQAIVNPVVNSLLELASCFEGLGGDVDKAIGTIWDSGVHPLSRKTSWQQIEKPRIEGNRLAVGEGVQDAICNLLDALKKYIATTGLPTILTKGATNWLLSSIRKSTWHARIDRLSQPKVIEVPISKLQTESKYRGKSEEKIFNQARFTLEDAFQRRGDLPSVEELQNETALSPKQRQAIVLRMSIAKNENRIASFREVGKLMGTTKGTAKQHWERGSEKLRDKYEVAL